MRSAVLLCPDGCGDVLTLNLDQRVGEAWKIYQSPRGVTLFPSVWRDTGCRSHFILWNSVLYWMDRFDALESSEQRDETFENRVWDALKPDVMTSFVVIADTIKEVPWAVLSACKSLVKAKRAVEGNGSLKNSFGRASPMK